MTLEDIRPHPQFDFDSTKNSGKPRCMQIITDKGIVETPTRIATNSEILSKSEIPLAMSLPMEICVAFRPLEQQVMEFFAKETSIKCSDLIKKTHQFNNLTTRAKLRMSFFQPAEVALENMTMSSKLEFARIQAEYLQKRMGYDVITYPYLDLGSNDYIKFIDDNYDRNPDFTTVFTIDMKMEEASFKKIVSHLLSKPEPKIIALIYRDWEDTVGQHDFIATHYKDTRTIFMACQVEREDKRNHLNRLHEICHNAFDLVALKQNARGGKLERDPNKIRIFNPNSKAIAGVIETMQNPDRDLVKEIEVPSDNFNDENLVHKMVDGYKGIIKSDRKFRKWYHLARIHELIVSKKEFSALRSGLLSGTTSEYIANSELKLSNLIKSLNNS